MPEYILKVDENHVDLRLDVYITETLSDIPSRSFVSKLFKARSVLVNGQEVKPHYKVALGDAVCVQFEEILDLYDSIEPEPIPLNILYEDQDIIVIIKPAGMLVHPARGVYTGTLVNALLAHYGGLSDVNSKQRPGIVHRLDRETSGLMVVAKNNIAHIRLARQFEKHKIKKQYVALVAGKVSFDEGIVEAAIGRDLRRHDKKRVVYDESGKESKTYYKVLHRFDRCSYVALYPYTGRTHQLRVHMAHMGHPILGDDKYGDKHSFARLALHAHGLELQLPSTKKYMEFLSPPPREFLDL